MKRAKRKGMSKGPKDITANSNLIASLQGGFDLFEQVAQSFDLHSEIIQLSFHRRAQAIVPQYA